MRAPRLEVLARLRRPGQLEVPGVRVEEAEPDLRIAARAVGRPKVVRQHPPDVPVVVAVAGVAHRRRGPDPPGAAAGPVDHLVDDPGFLRRCPTPADLERAPADVDHHAVEAEQPTAAGGLLDPEPGDLGDLQVGQLVRRRRHRRDRQHAVDDAQDPDDGDQANGRTAANVSRHSGERYTGSAMGVSPGWRRPRVRRIGAGPRPARSRAVARAARGPACAAGSTAA